MNNDFEKLQVLACKKGTPAGKIEKWRSTIKDGFVLSINRTAVNSIAQVKQIINNATTPFLNVMISSMDKQAMHSQTGVSQLYFDQLNHIDKHLF